MISVYLSCWDSAVDLKIMKGADPGIALLGLSRSLLPLWFLGHGHCWWVKCGIKCVERSPVGWFWVHLVNSDFFWSHINCLRELCRTPFKIFFVCEWRSLDELLPFFLFSFIYYSVGVLQVFLTWQFWSEVSLQNVLSFHPVVQRNVGNEREDD